MRDFPDTKSDMATCHFFKNAKFDVLILQSHKALALRRLSERPGAEAAAAEDGDEEAVLALAAERKAALAAQRKDAVEGRKALFVHVRLNRVHCRVTYQVLPSFVIPTVLSSHSCCASMLSRSPAAGSTARCRLPSPLLPDSLFQCQPALPGALALGLLSLKPWV